MFELNYHGSFVHIFENMSTLDTNKPQMIINCIAKAHQKKFSKHSIPTKSKGMINPKIPLALSLSIPFNQVPKDCKGFPSCPTIFSTKLQQTKMTCVGGKC